MRRLFVYDLSDKVTDYLTAWRYQLALVEHASNRRKSLSPGSDDFDVLLMVQHPSVYTLGRGASLKNIKFDVAAHQRQEGPQVFRIERGGEVTWHGYGQLVAYPILDLNCHKRDLHWYTNCLEESVIKAVAKFGVRGSRSEVNTGVWVGSQKLCAIGVSATRWVTYHGLALNVNCDLRHFDLIVPCGIRDPTRGVCSMASIFASSSHLTHPSPVVLSSTEVTIATIVPHLVESFSRVFSLRAEWQPEAEQYLRHLSEVQYPAVREKEILAVFNTRGSD